MTDEDGFLAAIRANPADGVARLAYADWLEEHDGDEALGKAEYLRTDHRVAELADDDPARDALILRLRELARHLHTDWKAAVARLPIENCDVRWEFACPKKWEQLQPTDDPLVRSCTACQQQVRYCDSIAAARSVAVSGGCVAVDLRVRRSPRDLEPQPTRVTMGKLVPLLTPQEIERRRQERRARGEGER